MTQTDNGTTSDTYISSEVANKFLTLWYEIYPDEKGVMKSTQDTIKRILMHEEEIEKFFEKYYLYDNWIFEIEDNTLKNVLIAPKVTEHAEKRMVERANVSKSEIKETVTLAMIHGRVLSKKERAQQHIRVQPNTKLLLYINLIFVISNHTLITVISFDT